MWRTQQVLRHWICCWVLPRLNSEHIFACANLLNISNSLLSQRIDCLLHVRVNLIKRKHRAQLFLHQLCGTFAKRLNQDEKVVILNVEVTSLYHVNLRYSFFLHIIVFFYDFTVILFWNISKRNLCASTPWRNGSASDSRSEGCVFKSRRDQLFAFPALNSSVSLPSNSLQKESTKYCSIESVA